MFFQISPVKREQKPKPVNDEPKPEKIEILSLAPFAPAPKLFFDRIKVGETATCKLLLRNPTKQNITIFLTKKLPEQLNVSYSWDSKTIEKESDVLFELTWRPICEESSYHKISFDSTRSTVHRDVPIAFKSILPNKAKSNKTIKRKSPQKSPTKKYYSTRPPNISSKKFSPSPKRNKTITKITSPKITVLSTQNRNTNAYHLTENVTSVFEQSGVSEQINFNTNYFDKVERRHTYIFNRDDSQEFEDSLEIVSPKSTQMSTPFIKKRAPLAAHNVHELTQDISLGTYFKQKSYTPERSLNYGFEYKLMHSDSICFTPTEKSVKVNKENVSPKNKNEHVQFELPANLNISSETYVKSNLSSETYVKDNISFETYVKGNVSGATYTKDSSVAQLESLSPLSVTFSPTNHRKFPQKQANAHLKEVDNPNNYINSVRCERQTTLWSIEEESSYYDNKLPVKRKKCDLDLTANHAKVGGGLLSGPKNWSRKGGAAYRISKNTSGLNLKRPNDVPSEKLKETAVISQISKRDSNNIIIQNPFLLAATDSVDPFITPQLYVSDQWVDQQEKDFKKWLNSLLTPPEELLSEDKGVDVARVWQECKKREVETAPTKEEISNKYHVNAKLNSLRKSAQNLYRSKEMNDVLSKVLLAVDNGKLSIRQDKDVHLNLSIKSDIMRIVLSYNPLWLRIGLETIYNETIPLNSNSDIVGLGTFIVNRLFKDPYLLRKYKSIYTPKYVEGFNKFFLKKFLILVYFLDQAKTRKLIPHNPCLFCKTAAIKESRELLLMLARELLSAVGDITKFLKFSGYVVTYVQTYIHEFDYAVKNLGVDLRDGVRLTKVMEIILMKEDFTSNLRVPAISRLQKVHNMKLVFDALEKAGFKILFDISPKDIVDGHREKTMSFLWQIIYKFEAPLMVKHATTIQVWFRSLPVVLKRRKLERIRLEKENAASKIQKWYKNQVLSGKIFRFAEKLAQYLHLVKIEKASVKIQSFYRMYRKRSVYIEKMVTIREIQRFGRGWLVRNAYLNRIKSAALIQSYVRMFLARKTFLRLKKATQVIQQWHRSRVQTEIEMKKYQKLRCTTVLVQRKWRAKKQKDEYQKLKLATLTIQRWYRATKLSQFEHQKFHKIKSTTIKIQKWYRSIKIMKIHRREYLTLKQTVLIVEQRYIASKMMMKEKENYQTVRKASIIIQQRYRAQIMMKETKRHYLQIKNASVVLQQRYRAKKAMESQMVYYKSLKQAVITTQSQYKAKLAMRVDRNNFLTIKKASITIQLRYRAQVMMKVAKYQYLQLKNASVVLQQRYRAKKAMERQLVYYKSLKQAVITIQSQYKAMLAMRVDRNNYLTMKKASIIFQQRYRAQVMMKLAKYQYLQLKNASVVLQQRYRAKKLMESQMEYYKSLKQAAITIQSHYKAKLAMRVDRNNYLTMKKASIIIQQRYRAQVMTKVAKYQYLQLKNASVVLQQRYRAKKLMESQMEYYKSLKQAAITIQRQYKAKLAMRVDRQNFLALKNVTVKIQIWLRAKIEMNKCRKEYLALRHAVITVQDKYRAQVLMKNNLEKYQRFRKATITIQTQLRALLAMRHCKNRYCQLKRAVVLTQRRFRANRAMKIHRTNYLQLKKAATVLQIRFRANKKMQECKKRFDTVKNAVVNIQRRYRANCLMKKARKEYCDLLRCTTTIQRLFRAKRSMIKDRDNYIKLKESVRNVQARWRAKRSGKIQKQNYLTLKKSTVIVQQRWRANKMALKQRMQYQKLLKAIIVVQQQWRAKKLGETVRKDYIAVREATLVFQAHWRAKKLGETEQKRFVLMKKAAVVIQTKFRATLQSRIERNRFKRMKRAASILQVRWRAYTARNKEQRIYQKLRISTLLIQCYWKAVISSRVERNKYLELKMFTIIIQRKWRATVEFKKRRREYLSLRTATIFVQQKWRAKILTREASNYYQKLKAAAIFVQKSWKLKILARKDRQTFVKLKSNTLFIQRRWRALRLGTKALQEYKKIKEAAVFIQRRYRANKLMKTSLKRYTSLKKATIVLQRWYTAIHEMKIQKTNYLKIRTATLTIQRWYKGCLKVREECRKFLVKRKTVAELQTIARGYLIRKKYAEYFTEEAREKRKIDRVRNASAIKIQSLWRGYKSRCKEDPKLKPIRQRYIKAHAAVVPEKLLAYKCQVAFETFVNHTTMSHIIKALEDIEYTTRRCKNQCILLGINLLPEQLYVMVSCMTRSLPEMNVCTLAVKVLINFNKLEDTKKYSFVPSYIDKLVTIMLHWCDKETHLFPTICTLFWLFAHTPQWRRCILNLPNINQKLEKIKGLVSRKESMVKRSVGKGTSVFDDYKNLPMPSLVPDWGLDYKNNPNVFSNSVHALKSLLSILNVGLEF